MRALSLRQPWAWYVVRPDLRGDARVVCKNVENRRWNTHYRGPVLIHAASRMKEAEYLKAVAWVREHMGPGFAVPQISDLQLGGIVGSATITGLLAPELQPTVPWHMEQQYGFQLADIVPLPFLAQRGALGLFNIPWTSNT